MTNLTATSAPTLPGTLLRKRDVYVPGLMSPYVPVDADTFEQTVREGHEAAFAPSGCVRPLPVTRLADLDALHALYLGGAACAGPVASLVAAISTLQSDGWTFTDGRADVGAYGAYLALQDRLPGRPVQAATDGVPLVPLQAADASAIVARAHDARCQYLAVLPVASGGDLLPLLDEVRHLPPERQPLFLALQGATGDLGWTRDAWKAIGDCGFDVAESTELMRQSLKSERSVRQAVEELQAARRHIRPGETLPQITAQLERIRQALPHDRVIETAMTFTGMRTTVAPEHESLFLHLVRRYEDGMHAAWMWGLLKAAGPPQTLERRVRLVTAQPKELWPALIDRVRSLPKRLPHDVEPRRAEAALLPLATLPDARCVSRVTQTLEATPAADDRTDRLERLARIMLTAGTPAAFDEGCAVVGRAGAPGGAPLRERVLSELAAATLGSGAGLAPALALMARADRDAATFDSIARHAVAFAAALPGHAEAAAEAFGLILDARAAGDLAPEPLDDTLARFVAHYAATRSVDSAMHRLRAPLPTDGRVSRDGDGVVVGGIRVPRAPRLYEWVSC